MLGLALAVRGDCRLSLRESTCFRGAKADTLTSHPPADAWTALEKSLHIWQKQDDKQAEGLVSAFMAEVALWQGDWSTARPRADRAWELAAVDKHEADFIRAARLQGTAALRTWVALAASSLANSAASSVSQLPTTEFGERGGVSPPTFEFNLGGLTPPCSPVSRETSSAGRGQHTLPATSPFADARSVPPELHHEFARERLLHALTRARACQLVEEELPALIALAELHEAQASVAFRSAKARSAATEPLGGAGCEPAKGMQERQAGSLSHGEDPPFAERRATIDEHLAEARRFLDDVWDRAQRGPYPLFHADACNQLVSLELLTQQVIDAELATNTSSERRQHLQAERIQALTRAQTAAVQAYELSWLDGPPFAYARCLARATEHRAPSTEHRQTLGLPLPQLEPFDESRFEPMPDVPIIAPKKRKRSRKKKS